MPSPALSLERILLPSDPTPKTESIILHHPLHRILAFTGLTIDNIIDSPIARNTVYGYFKLHKQIQRTHEIIDLERQWNPTATP
jgi:hypothetical protein